VIYTIGPYLLPDLVRQMIPRTPQMPLMLQENFTVKLLEMLRTGEIDCAILAEPFPDAGLAMAPLYDEPFLAAVPTSHPLAATASVTTEQLKKETMLLLGTGIAFATMCWRSAPNSPAFPAMPRASARALKARRWRPSNTWWRPAWASRWCRA
jgi:DNA-binding transcriptional LysR family regulator